MKPASKIKLIILFVTISELELRMEERLRGTLMELRELNKIAHYNLYYSVYFNVLIWKLYYYRIISWYL